MKTEIIIVKYKNPEVEKRCIESVKKYTDLNQHKLTVFDNAPENINLGKLWNQLIYQSNTEFICLLNSDTVAEEGWTRMFDVLKDQKVGVVGPITNNAGTVQKKLSREDRIEEVNDLSGFCFCFRKEVWKEVGGFPEDMPFYGQESIFNRKLEDCGYKFIVDRRVFVHHNKASSFDKAKERGEMTNDEAKWGAFHFYNYKSRLELLRQAVDKDFKIAVVGGGKGNPFPLHKGIEEAVYEMFGDKGLILSAADDNVEALEEFKPDMYLSLQTGFNKNLFDGIRKAKSLGATTVLYFNDLRCPGHKTWDVPYKMTSENYFDFIFIGNTEFIDVWKKKMKVPNVFYLPQASLQHPRPPKGKFYKHLHIGGFHSRYHQNRIQMFGELNDLDITHLNAKGDGNNELREDRIKIQNNSYGDYGSSNFSWGISPEAERYTSDRLYTILGSGGCAIHYKSHGMEDVFSHKKHLYWFTSSDEARKIVGESTEEERDQIKLNAFVHVQKHHLYKVRLLNLLHNVYTSDNNFWGYLTNLKEIGKPV